jgi:CRP-like cAMP-binding protein
MKKLPMPTEGLRELSSHVRKISFFEGLSIRHLELLLDVTSLYEVDAGDVIFRKGKVGDALYIISKGSIDIVQKRWLFFTKRIARLGAGDFFGEMALLDQPYRTATAVAHEKSQLFVLLNIHFNELIRDNPDFANALRGAAAQRKFETRNN